MQVKRGGTVLVTGGMGFIGSHVCDALLRHGYKVLSFDRRWHAHGPVDVEYIVGDIRDREAVFNAVEGADGVIHLAGILGTAETVGTARNSVEVNVVGGLNVFDAIQHYKVPAVNIAVGNVGWLSSYPISKHTAEQFALMFNREFGTQIAVVRGLNVYGPRQKYKPIKKFAPNFIRSALMDEPITVYGDGQQVMDVIYVEDCAEILVRALVLPHGCYNRVMEAGMGKEVTALEVAWLVWALCRPGVEPKIHFAPMRPGEPKRSVTLGNPETLEPLGWAMGNFKSLETGMAMTVAWYREHAHLLDMPGVAV